MLAIRVGLSRVAECRGDTALRARMSRSDGTQHAVVARWLRARVIGCDGGVGLHLPRAPVLYEDRHPTVARSWCEALQRAAGDDRPGMGFWRANRMQPRARRDSARQHRAGWSPVMSMTKISAGSGYGYLTQHTAAQDQAVGRGGLAAYYEERGESPGMWVGGGLAALDIEPGATVTEDQMKALFAHGHHPVTSEPLGVPFPKPAGSSPLGAALAQHLAEHNEALGKPRCAPVSPAVRAAARTAVATEMFNVEHGRLPTDARELSSFIAVASRRSLRRGRGVRPDVLAGEERLHPVGRRRRGDRAADRGRAPRRRRRHPGVDRTDRAVHPPRPQRGAAGRGARAGRGRVHPPRLPRRGSGPAHPRRDLQQGPDPRRAVAGDGRPGAAQGHRRRVGAVQHPPGGRTARTARDPVRRTPRPRSRQTRRCARSPASTPT